MGAEANTLPYEAVLELSAASAPALAAAVSSSSDLLAAADLAVITREAVLWDRLP